MNLLLASATAELVREWAFTPSELFWQAVIVLAIVLLNAFFVAAEFAIVKVRDSQLTAAIDDGVSGAKFAQHVTRNLDAYLSAGQLGITLTSIALGIFGEPFVAIVVQPMLFKMGIVNETVIRWTSIGIAYAIVTYLHVVLGEQTPKVLAIRCSSPGRCTSFTSYSSPPSGSSVPAPTSCCASLASPMSPSTRSLTPKRNSVTSSPRARSPKRSPKPRRIFFSTPSPSTTAACVM
jgi:hypothetical protein